MVYVVVLWLCATSVGILLSFDFWQCEGQGMLALTGDCVMVACDDAATATAPTPFKAYKRRGLWPSHAFGESPSALLAESAHPEGVQAPFVVAVSCSSTDMGLRSWNVTEEALCCLWWADHGCQSEAPNSNDTLCLCACFSVSLDVLSWPWVVFVFCVVAAV